MFSLAFAMGAGGQGGGAGGGMGAFIPLILMFAIFYFLLIRPQQKKSKEHREMISALKKGDHIVTSGGLRGRIIGLTDRVITLEVAENVTVKISRGYVADLLDKE